MFNRLWGCRGNLKLIARWSERVKSSLLLPVLFQDASFEYMEKESEIQLLEALDQLEVAFSESVSSFRVSRLCYTAGQNTQRPNVLQVVSVILRIQHHAAQRRRGSVSGRQFYQVTPSLQSVSRLVSRLVFFSCPCHAAHSIASPAVLCLSSLSSFCVWCVVRAAAQENGL